MNTQYNTQLHPVSSEEIHLLINDLFLTAEYKGTYTVTNNDLLNFAYAVLKRAMAKNAVDEAVTTLRQQQDLLDGYHKQSLNDSRAISKLVGEMAEKEAEIEALKADNEQMCKALFKATRAILRKAQEK